MIEPEADIASHCQERPPFAGQFGFGLQYAVGGGFVLDGGYRLLGQDRRNDNFTYGVLLGAKFHF